MLVRVAPCVITAALVAVTSSSLAFAAPVPTGVHLRLFMSAANVAAFTKNAATPGTAAAKLVAACQDTIDNPQDYSTRGGSDGDYWPGVVVATPAKDPGAEQRRSCSSSASRASPGGARADAGNAQTGHVAPGIANRVPGGNLSPKNSSSNDRS